MSELNYDMDRSFYIRLTEKSLAGVALTKEECIQILTSSGIELLPLLDAAYQVRKKYT